MRETCTQILTKCTLACPPRPKGFTGSYFSGFKKHPSNWSCRFSPVSTWAPVTASCPESSTSGSPAVLCSAIDCLKALSQNTVKLHVSSITHGARATVRNVKRCQQRAHRKSLAPISDQEADYEQIWVGLPSQLLLQIPNKTQPNRVFPHISLITRSNRRLGERVRYVCWGGRVVAM